MARKKYPTVGPMERAERARRNGEKINRNCPPCAAGPHGDPPAAGPGAGATGPGSLSVPPFGAAQCKMRNLRTGKRTQEARGSALKQRPIFRGDRFCVFNPCARRAFPDSGDVC